MAQSFLYRMPAGIAGDINRAQQAVVRPEVITAAGATSPAAYGLAVVIDATSGQLRLPADPDTAIDGILARPFPTNSSTSALGTSVPPTSGVVDMLMRGFISVKLAGSTAAKNGGLVYVWSSASSGAHVLGGFEAADPSGDGFVVAGAKFSGGADADGNTEISLLP